MVFEVGGTVSGPGIGRRPAHVERRVERVDDRRQALDRARAGALQPATPRSGRTGVTTVISSFDRIEHHDDGRADQHRVGNADRVGVGLRQLLHQAHHVVAEIAEDAGRHRRQPVGQRDAAFGDQRAQRCQRRPRCRARRRRARCARVRLISACAVDERQIRSGSRPMIE